MVRDIEMDHFGVFDKYTWIYESKLSPRALSDLCFHSLKIKIKIT